MIPMTTRTTSRRETTMAMDDRIRTSDADRERVAARLRDHFAEGRLTREELDERLAAALNAKTHGDLRRVLADLPEPGPVRAPDGCSWACSRSSCCSGWWAAWQRSSWLPGSARWRGSTGTATATTTGTT